MNKITTILLIIIALGCSAQEPDMNTYSVELHNSITDSIITHYENLLLFNTQGCNDALIECSAMIDSLMTLINERDSIIENNFIRPDIYDLTYDADGISVQTKRDSNNVWLSIIEGEKRSHLWLIDGRIEVRFAIDTVQGQTWLPEERLINY